MLARLENLLKAGRARGMRGELMRGNLFGAILRVGEVGIGLASIAISARALGVDGLGVFALATSCAMLASIPAAAGLPMLVMREMSTAKVAGELERMKGVLSFSGAFVVISSAIVASVGAGIIALVSDRLPPGLAPTFYWALILVPLHSLGNVRGATLRALRKPVLSQIPELLIRPLGYVLLMGGAFLLFPGWLNPARAMMLQTAAAAAAFLFGAYYVWRSLPPELSRVRPAITARAWLASSIPMSLTHGLRTLQPHGAILLLGALAAPEATGLFRIGQTAAGLASFAQSTLATVVTPYLAHLHAEGRKSDLQRLVTASAWLGVTGGAVVTLAFLALGPDLLNTLLGRDFGPAFSCILLLCAAQTMNAGFGPNNLLLNMAHRERTVAVAFFIGVPAQMIVSALLIPGLGQIGAAIGLATSLLTWNLIVSWDARRTLGVRTTIFGL